MVHADPAAEYPTAALANAVSDALAPLGIEINELPITPQRLFELVRGRNAE